MHDDKIAGENEWITHKPRRFCLDIIRIGLCEDNNQINKSANEKEACGKDVKHTHAALAFIKLVCANRSKEQAQKESYPFVAFFLLSRSAVYVYVLILVCVVDHHVGLSMLHLLNLFATLGANDTFLIDQLSAMLAIFLIFRHTVFLFHNDIPFLYYFHGYAVVFYFLNIMR